MPLKKELTHRFIKALQVVLPVVMVVLIGVLAWNYWAKVRGRVRLPNLSQLPKELALRTENFNFSKTQGDRTLFTIHAQTNLGFSDDKNMLEGVDAIIYGDDPSDPPRKLKALNCSYNHKTDDMECSGNVELQVDDATTVRTEKAVYNQSNHTITANTPSRIVRTDSMTGEANNLEYVMTSGLLKLTGAVKIHGAQGVDLESESAVFQQKENWATATDVLMRSKNGWIRGKQARAELTPVTFQPKTVVVDGDVSSESSSPDSDAIWNLRSNWVQAALSPKGVVEHVLARTNVELAKKASDGSMVMSGGEIETQMNDVGRMDYVEGRQNPRMKFGDDRLLIGEKIFANAEESVSTTGSSVLQVGDSQVTGSVFSIQNGDVVKFHTEKRATLTQQERVTSADNTDAEFDNHTNQLVSLVQSGHFTMKQTGDQTARANRAIIESGGDILTLEGSAKVNDPKMQVEASTIRIDNKTNTKTANKNVKTVSVDSGERVLVTADSVIQTEDKATYTGTSRDKVHLYRGAGSIEADKIEGPVGSKVFRATAIGHVFSTLNNIRAWADRLEYDDGTHIAHYIGAVTALKQDMKTTGADMIVKMNSDTPKTSSQLTESSVQEITTTGSVVVTRSDSRGTGDRAVYDADTQQVVLTSANGKAQVIDGDGNTTQGPRITVNVSGDKMTVVEGSGNQRGVTTHRLKP